MFNVGMFMGWADLSAQIGRDIPWDILIPMYVGTCLWTFTYETVYQHQVRYLVQDCYTRRLIKIFASNRIN